MTTAQQYNKFLKKSLKGFTLIELMVVVAIIGILSVVGLGVFNGVQASARDAVVIQEIDSLAKNIESTRDPQTGKYLYNAARIAADYPNVTNTPKFAYCVATTDNTGTSTTPPVVPTKGSWAAGACTSATAWSIVNLKAKTLTEGSTVTNRISTATPNFIVCGWLERSNTPYCKTNSIR